MAKFELRFDDDDNVPACCRVAALLSPLGMLQIAILELADNHARSVTNSWPILAKRVLAAKFPGVAIADVQWFEVYPDGFDKENVSRVLLSADGLNHRFEYERDALVRKRILRALEIDV